MKLLRIVIILFMFILPAHLLADEPPDPGGGPGSGDLPVGGGAPVGEGVSLLIILSAGYLSKKVFNANKDR